VRSSLAASPCFVPVNLLILRSICAAPAGNLPLTFLLPYAAYFFFAAFTFAHRARCAAAILFLPAADIVRLGFGARPLAFPHRARCARLIRLRANADTPRFGLVELRPPPNLPRTERAASTC